jgi:hypothetical protein
MKNSITITIMIIVLALLSQTLLNAQTSTIENIFVQVNDSTCTTSECDVVVRQYTGVYVGWKLAVRCIDAGGWSPWYVWEGSGVYGGTVCGG